jgi:hypothetical protein
MTTPASDDEDTTPTLLPIAECAKPLMENTAGLRVHNVSQSKMYEPKWLSMLMFKGGKQCMG